MHDVIIVGSGVAGGYLAQKLEGLDVLVVEKSKDASLKDSGIVSSRFFDFVRVGRLVEHEITEMRAVAPSGNSFYLRSEKPFAYLLDRLELSRFLMKGAARSAEMAFEMVKDVEYFKSHVHVTTNEGSYDARMVVGADGALSKVRKSMGISPPGKMYAGMFVRSQEPVGEGVDVFFNKYYSPDFFSWTIGQNREYGLITSIRPAEYLDYFRGHQGLPEGTLRSYLVPAGFTRSYGDRALLVGESCGQVKPISGGGIVFSLVAARHAARVIREAFANDRFDARMLGNYERLWRGELSWEIRLQLLVRNAYRWLTNKDIEKLFRDFGPRIEDARGFDYDHLSGIVSGLPKWKLMQHAVANVPYVLRG
ncbi:MAG: NAD(P)/FAD-dependent oxidoreductase [Candidatus Aenigmarchaeota archaeon]|nr:NAD(P)/FAD-dependent oxidoreductase [Candidatus Aenigmarchaeota archaeon]